MSWRAVTRRGAPIAAFVAAACSSSPTGAPARVTIPVGTSLRAAAESLHHAGVVRATALFRVYAKVRGFDRGIKAGTYALNRDASWESVLQALRSGRGIVNTVTIPEGFSLAQITTLLVEKMHVPAESIAAAVSDTALRRRLDVPTPTVEGYLFPDTYVFPPGTSARAAVTTMVRRFEQQWDEKWKPRLDSMAVSRHDVVTLASIVEMEARLPEERPVIAAVYWNRLRNRMLLQADPTVQFALPQHQTRLLYKHLKVQSAYNTYQNLGLPPGPIASPGHASLRATVYYADVPYRYFVAHPDGHHEFRVTLEQHEAAKRLARRAWDALRTQKAAAKKTPAPATGTR